MWFSHLPYLHYVHFIHTVFYHPGDPDTVQGGWQRNAQETDDVCVHAYSPPQVTSKKSSGKQCMCERGYSFLPSCLTPIIPFGAWAVDLQRWQD